ncbi:hypothetical protein FRB91_001161 [Serendipita sp. 411]|nr:hypothetical protein FRB91_001161 [Serendipita sp. 411]
MSVDVLFKVSSSPEERCVQFPLVQGSAFISALYTKLTPRFGSGVFFRSFQQRAISPDHSVARIVLEDGYTWLLHCFPKDGQPLQLRLSNNSCIEGNRAFTGVVQLIKVPRCHAPSDFEALVERCAGKWPTSVIVSASNNTPSVSEYQFHFKTGCASQASSLLMYALPHHVDTFVDPSIVHRRFEMYSTTKGKMVAVVADQWKMKEIGLPDNTSFELSSDENPAENDETRLIHTIAAAEANGDPCSESNLDSMYFSGKALDKYACLCWVICSVVCDVELAKRLLSKLKEAFARFANNQQQFPLVYDSVWGGVVSSGMYQTGNLLQDFGNGCYNDHHFHYGYFIHTAALIAKMDQRLNNGDEWYQQNKDYINMLIRDAANADPSDKHFPLSRCFDWFHGHSWAKGLFESWDSKDQESTSEDAYFSYSLKLWGNISCNPQLERLASLMLGIQRRVFRSYFLMEQSNKNQPANFIKNKVTGILFENKVDHTTYFGNDIRFIQGIHMIPVSQISCYIRSQEFVAEEWERYFSEDHLTGDDGWKGILYSNLSIIDASRAWDFFARPDFQTKWLDQGATRSWYLAICAAQM